MNTFSNNLNMKSNRFALLHFSLIFIFVFTIWFATPAQAGQPLQDNPTETPTPTASATATITPTLEPPRPEFERPVVIINSYSTNPNPVNVGQDFNISFQIYNTGQTSARNIVIAFTPGEFLPRNTGGVIAVPNIFPGNRQDLNQTMNAGWALLGQPVSTLDMNVSYTDELGNSYTEKFNLVINLKVPSGSAATLTPTPTITPTPTKPTIQKPQIVITNYESDIDPLEPGSIFNLNMQISNLGNANAQRVTMIVGGGSISDFGETPQPGGISGAGGEFSNFAPLGASNIQTIGTVAAGSTMNVNQTLIVNVTTNPGAYPMKISFVYLSEDGIPQTDEQVITLLVYDLPSVEINFYRDPGPVFTGQVNMLPIQITNLGRKTSILGNMQVTAQSGSFENNIILIGPLDPGGYYTMDASYIPDVAGTTELNISVDYTDDFNQSRQISKMITIEVMEFIPPEEPFPGEGTPEYPSPELPESFFHKVWRFILGLLGLDSGKKQNTAPIGISPEESVPIENGEGSRPLKGP